MEQEFSASVQRTKPEGPPAILLVINIIINKGVAGLGAGITLIITLIITV